MLHSFHNFRSIKILKKKKKEYNLMWIKTKSWRLSQFFCNLLLYSLYFKSAKSINKMTIGIKTNSVVSYLKAIAVQSMLKLLPTMWQRLAQFQQPMITSRAIMVRKIYNGFKCYYGYMI